MLPCLVSCTQFKMTAWVPEALRCIRSVVLGDAFEAHCVGLCGAVLTGPAHIPPQTPSRICVAAATFRSTQASTFISISTYTHMSYVYYHNTDASSDNNNHDHNHSTYMYTYMCVNKTV